MTTKPNTIGCFQSPRNDGGPGGYIGYFCHCCGHLHIYPQRARLNVSDEIQVPSACCEESGSPNYGVPVILHVLGPVRDLRRLDRRTNGAMQRDPLYKSLGGLSGHIERVMSGSAIAVLMVADTSASSVADIAYSLADALVPNMHHISLEFRDMIDAWYARGCPSRRGAAGGTSAAARLCRLDDPLSAIDDFVPLLAAALLPEVLAAKVTDGRSLTDLVKTQYGLSLGMTVLRIFEAIGGVNLDAESAGQFCGLIDGYDSFHSGWKPSYPGSHPVPTSPRRPVKPLPGLDEILGDDFEDAEEETA